MYLTQTNYIRHLPKNQYEAILEMCAYANNLYNVGLYQIRQHFFATHQYLRYEENYHLCKGNENYKLLQAGVLSEDCIAQKQTRLSMQISMEHATLRKKVSRTLMLRDCVEGFWQAR